MDAPLHEIGATERRHDARVEVDLSGRYQLSDDQEYPCRTLNISPGGVAFLGMKRGHIGERIVAYLSRVGRLEGTIARHFGAAFAVKLTISPHRRERLAQQLAWFSKQMAGARDGRSAERAPSRRRTVLKTEDGRQHFARIVDLSTTGAAIQVDVAPPIDSKVMLGPAAARVVRHFEGGIAVTFNEPLARSSLLVTSDAQGA